MMCFHVSRPCTDGRTPAPIPQADSQQELIMDRILLGVRIIGTAIAFWLATLMSAGAVGTHL
jgi:hypothetical protein